MKYERLTDPMLGADQERFVFVAIDTESPHNRDIVESLPISVWPTFFVIDPDTRRPLATFRGSGDAREWATFLLEGELAFDACRDGGAPSVWSVALLDGERHLSLGDAREAENAFGRALSMAPRDWSRRSEALAGLVSALRHLRKHARCATVGIEENTGPLRTHADLERAITVLVCAAELDQADPARASHVRQLVTEHTLLVARDATGRFIADDRADAYRASRQALVALGERDAAMSVAREERALLDDAVRAAEKPELVMAYDYPRMDVYTFLGVAPELLPELEALANALPREYDPPYRIAAILEQQGRLDESARWADRALVLARGPRREVILRLVERVARLRGAAAAQQRP